MKENFRSLSKASDITFFTAQYESFLDAMESLQGEAGHSDDKRLDIPLAQQSELFNEVHPEDLGVAKFAQTSRSDIVSMLGMYNFFTILTSLMPLMKAGMGTSHQI